MKYENLIYAGMVFVIVWTTILCLYHIELTKLETESIEIPPTQVAALEIAKEPTKHRKAFW